MNIEHPIISSMEKTGYPYGRAPRVPICPVCGYECDLVYFDRNREIFGCDNCVYTEDVYEALIEDDEYDN